MTTFWKIWVHIFWHKCFSYVLPCIYN